MVYTEAGEFSENAIVQEFTASAAITKGQVCTITAAATPTIAPTTNSDGSGNGPYCVAIEAIASAAVGRAVIMGEVACDASGNCYRGGFVYSKGGAAVARTLTSYDPETAAPTLGFVTEGAADGYVCTVYVTQGGI